MREFSQSTRERSGPDSAFSAFSAFPTSAKMSKMTNMPNRASLRPGVNFDCPIVFLQNRENHRICQKRRNPSFWALDVADMCGFLEKTNAGGASAVQDDRFLSKVVKFKKMMNFRKVPGGPARVGRSRDLPKCRKCRKCRICRKW